jgi:cyclopropane-fatty-acyl-phospholipid synthase
MSKITLINSVTDLFSIADIKVDGTRDWDIQVKHEGFYDKVIKDGPLGLGEAFMDGWWECKDLEEMIYRMLIFNVNKKYLSIINVHNIVEVAKIKFSPNFGIGLSKVDPFEVGRKHYDNGNKLYELMLGKSMSYSTGYFQDTDDLDIAQEQKFKLICEKLNLKEGMDVIDIGVGWGSLLIYMVKNYKVHGVGLTVSKEQKKYIEENYTDLNITIHLLDYQEFCKVSNMTFDRVFSVGMFEHVGLKNYDKYMQSVDTLLKNGGLSLLHTVGNKYTNDTKDPWMDTYIFPNAKIPSLQQIIDASSKYFDLEDLENFGLYYEKTLLAWYDNFDKNWNQIKDKYGDRFYRMWKYYLISYAAAFKSKNLHVWQIVYSKNYPTVFKRK